MQEDGTTRTQIVEQDPMGLRWNDAGEPSPYRVTPLYDSPGNLTPEQAAGLFVMLNHYGSDQRVQCLHDLLPEHLRRNLVA
jgi:hypothetical protein